MHENIKLPVILKRKSINIENKLYCGWGRKHKSINVLWFFFFLKNDNADGGPDSSDYGSMLYPI